MLSFYAKYSLLFRFCYVKHCCSCCKKALNNLQSRTNGKLKSHVLFWKSWLFGQIIQNVCIYQWIKMSHRASLASLGLRRQGNRLHSLYLIKVISSQYSQGVRKLKGTFSVFTLSPNYIFNRSETNERHVFLTTTCCSEHHSWWIFKWKWKLFLFPWFLFASFMPQTCVPSDQKWQLEVATHLQMTYWVTLGTSLLQGVQEQNICRQRKEDYHLSDIFLYTQVKIKVNL